MINSSPSVFFFVALSTEAKPLIQEFQLKKLLVPSPFELYVRNDVVLVVSGVGKIAMAAAVAYAGAYFSVEWPILINVGMAGHAALPLGQVCIADKIVDADSGKVFYPQLLGLHRLSSVGLRSWSQPQLTYDDALMCDMEAAGFFEIGVKLTSSELIQCVKVISDNRQHPADQRPDVEQVHDWLRQVIPELTLMQESLQVLRRALLAPDLPQLPEWVADLHFTVAQREQLRTLALRWRVLGCAEQNWPQQPFKSAKQLLLWMEEIIQLQPFHL